MEAYDRFLRVGCGGTPQLTPPIRNDLRVRAIHAILQESRKIPSAQGSIPGKQGSQAGLDPNHLAFGKAPAFRFDDSAEKGHTMSECPFALLPLLLGPVNSVAGTRLLRRFDGDRFVQHSTPPNQASKNCSGNGVTGLAPGVTTIEMTERSEEPSDARAMRYLPHLLTFPVFKR
jgi:hypothetical protein